MMAYYPTIGGPGGIHDGGMSIFADLIPVCPRVCDEHGFRNTAVHGNRGLNDAEIRQNLPVKKLYNRPLFYFCFAG